MERVDPDSIAAIREMLRKNDDEAELRENERRERLRERINGLDQKAKVISNRYHRSVVELVGDLLEEQERVRQQLHKLAAWKQPRKVIEDEAMGLHERIGDLGRLIAMFEDEMQPLDANRPTRNRPTLDGIRRRRDVVRALSVDPNPMSHREICRELDDHGFPIPTSAQWRQSGYKSWLRRFEEREHRQDVLGLQQESERSPAEVRAIGSERSPTTG